MNKLINQYLKVLAALTYAKGTIRYHKVYLQQFLDFLKQQEITDIREITKEVIHNYQQRISHSSLSSLTIHSKMSVLHNFFAFLIKENYLLFDPSDAIEFPKRTLGLPKSILTEDEVKRLLSLPDTTTKKGIRDRAIFEVLYSTAIRRAELVGLDLYDFNTDEYTLKVLGKGKKQRIVPVGDVAVFWVGKYLQNVRSALKTKEQALFLDFTYQGRLKKKTVNYIIHEYAQKSGIPKRITPHTFRHTCATHLLKNGADIRYIQQMLGHASPETTQIYARVEISDLKKVFQNTHPRAKRK